MSYSAKITLLTVALCLFLFASACTNEKRHQDADAQQSSTEVPGTGLMELDIERINSYYHHKGHLAEADYDFLLDQIAILGNIRQSMTPEQFKEYLAHPTEELASAILFLGISSYEGAKKGRLTDAQLERFESLKPILDFPR